MGFDPEKGTEFSGGGFSAFFRRPAYQNDAMNAYLPKLGSQYAGRFKCVRSRGLTPPILLYYLRSPLNRGVPDIALQSMNYAMVWQAKTTETRDSTSFSTNVRPILHLAHSRAPD